MKSLPQHREIADQVRVILGVLGVYLMIFGVAAAIWSIRASIGQARYASLLMHPRDPPGELTLARNAFRLYPRNYAVCIRAADTAFKASEAATNAPDAEHFRSEAEYWVERGMDLNPRLMELHYLKARLMARQNPAAAAAAWKAYSDWHFWDSGNLEILARFQDEAGLKDEAAQTRNLLKNRKE